MLKLFIAIVILMMPSVLFAARQARPDYLDEPASIAMYGQPEPGKTYPLIVFLQWTGSTSSQYFDAVAPTLGIDTFVAVFPAGRTSSEDYLPDFVSYVKWYEARLLADIKQAIAEYPVDTTKIYTSGFSLGGDLSWAFIIKQKELFAGALIIGSRCSWAATKKDLQYLVQQNKRIVFFAGESDLQARVVGMKDAATRVKKEGVISWLQYFDGGHTIPGDADLSTGFDIMFGRKAPAN